MFDNIGGKIKGLARFVCWMGILASVIYAFILWGATSRYQASPLPGFIVLVAGCLISWIGSFFTYGFGELIERATSIDNTLKSRAYSAPAPVQEEPVPVKPAESTPAKPAEPIKSVWDQDRQKMIEELRKKMDAGEECRDAYGWLIDYDDPQFVHCPECRKRFSSDYMKYRKACPDCHYVHTIIPDANSSEKMVSW